MSDTMSGLELRRAALEVLGWKQEPYCDWWHSPRCLDGDCHFPTHVADRRLPAIESDPAVAWPMFLEWCKKNNYGFILGTAVSYEDVKWPLFELALNRDDGYEGCLPEDVLNVEGVDICEALSRAIVAAGRKA